MSIIRRADGHVPGDNVSCSEEDREWEKVVLGAKVDYGSYYYEDNFCDDFSLFDNLWGTYQGECPHLTKNFDESFFYRQ